MAFLTGPRTTQTDQFGRTGGRVCSVSPSTLVSESSKQPQRQRQRQRLQVQVQEGKEKRLKMNTDITASAKPEYPVVDRNPPFTKVVGNFNTLDYLRFVTITGVSVTVGYLSGNSTFIYIIIM